MHKHGLWIFTLGLVSCDLISSPPKPAAVDAGDQVSNDATTRPDAPMGTDGGPRDVHAPDGTATDAPRDDAGAADALITVDTGPADLGPVDVDPRFDGSQLSSHDACRWAEARINQIMRDCYGDDWNPSMNIDLSCQYYTDEYCDYSEYFLCLGGGYSCDEDGLLSVETSHCEVRGCGTDAGPRPEAGVALASVEACERAETHYNNVYRECLGDSWDESSRIDFSCASLHSTICDLGAYYACVQNGLSCVEGIIQADTSQCEADCGIDAGPRPEAGVALATVEACESAEGHFNHTYESCLGDNWDESMIIDFSCESYFGITCDLSDFFVCYEQGLGCDQGAIVVAVEDCEATCE